MRARRSTQTPSVARYFTFAFSDAGGWSPTGLNLTRMLLRRAYPAVIDADGENVDAQLERRNATRELRTKVALAIQRGNARAWVTMFYNQQTKPHMAITQT